MTPSEREMVRRLAEETGLSEGDVLRQALRRAWAEQHGDDRPIKSKR